MKTLSVDVCFDDYQWEGIHGTMDTNSMCVNIERAIDLANDLIFDCEDDEVFAPPEGPSYIHAVVYDFNGAYLDTEDIYGRYEKGKGFIKED